MQRTLVMGIVNVTPDSFSDGGRWPDAEAALARGLHLLAQGADAIDVGGESTRPGAGRVAEADERSRVLPVVSELARSGALVSIDTTRARVAAEAVAAGARIINDVSAGTADPAMPEVMAAAASTGVRCVLMHSRGESATMASRTDYPRGVLTEVRDHLLARAGALVEAGVPQGAVVLDPGLGFAKDAEQNWALLAGLGELVADGFPVLVGASRKGFVGALLEGRPAVGAAPAGRDDATAAISALAAAAGVWGVRVHEVAASADAVRVAQRWSGQRGSQQPVGRP